MEKPVFLPDPIFKLQHKVWKFNICLSWSSPKTDLEMNFLILIVLRTSVFLNSDFCQKLSRAWEWADGVKFS